jgi:hypothetical protein
VIDLVGSQVVNMKFLFSFFLNLKPYLEVCISNSIIRTVLLKAENKFEEKRKRAEQSDDSLEEEFEETIDSLSDEDNNDDDLQELFMPIPQRPQM